MPQSEESLQMSYKYSVSLVNLLQQLFIMLSDAQASLDRQEAAERGTVQYGLVQYLKTWGCTSRAGQSSELSPNKASSRFPVKLDETSEVSEGGRKYCRQYWAPLWRITGTSMG